MEIFQDWARVVESGEPLGGATVTVYETGTLNLANLFSDNAGVTPLANPFTADAVTGIFAFYAADGHYDVTITKTGATPYTLTYVLLATP